jgi:hypothetical protein
MEVRFFEQKTHQKKRFFAVSVSFKLNFDEWTEMMALSPENPRPQQVTFESHSKAMRESTSYKE